MGARWDWHGGGRSPLAAAAPPTLRLTPRAALLVGVLAGPLIGGCSQYALQSSPLWDAGEPAAPARADDRVNLWPLLYWREPTLSVLWPLITLTAEGHAIMPLYEYRRQQRHLRLGTVHPWVPAAVDWHAGLGRYRVLNARWDAGRRQFVVLPLYSHRLGPDGHLLLAPLLYRNRHGLWTPAVTWRDDLKGALGPLFCRSGASGRYTYHAPFPLVAWWRHPDRRGVRAWPLFDWQADSGMRRLRLGVVPMATDQHGPTGLVMGGWARDQDGACRRHWLMPFWYSWRTPSQRSFFSLPWTRLAWDRGSFTSVCALAYLDIRGEGERHRSLLWPVAHCWRGPRSADHAVLPLYLTRREANGDRGFYSAPISWSADGTMRNVGVILFHHRRKAGGYYTTLLWPLAHRWKSDRSTGSALVPVYYQRRGSDGERLVLTPLAAYTRDSEHWGLYSLPLSVGRRPAAGDVFVNVGLFLFHRGRSPGRTRTDVLWPWIGWEEDRPRQRRAWHVWPLAAYARDPDAGRFWSPLVAVAQWRRDADVVSRLLAERAQEQHERLGWQAAGAADAGATPMAEPPVTIRQGEVVGLLGLFRLERRGWARRMPAARDEAGAAAGDARAQAAGDVAGDTAGAAARPAVLQYGWRDQCRLFPVFSRSADPAAGRASVLWRVYDYERREQLAAGVACRRHRILWRLYCRQSCGSRTSTDMFPFVSWDRDAEAGTARFVFAGGLFEYRRDEAGARVGVVTPLLRNLGRIGRSRR